MTHDQLKSKRAELKALLNGWAGSSTIHGYSRIFQTDKWPLKILWLLFSLGSTGFLAYLVSKSIMDYLTHEVVTKIRVYNEVPLEFPTVTICNINPFTKTAADNLFDEILSQNGHSNTDDENILKEYFEDFLVKAMNPSKTDDYRKSLGPTLDEMLVDCDFSDISCTENSNFEWFYMIEYGNCFRFNSGKDFYGNKTSIKKSYLPGKVYGLNLELMADKTISKLGIKSMSGIKLFIDNSSFYPNYLTNGIDLKTGTHTNIVLKTVFNEREPEPYSECKKEITSESYKNMINMGKTYEKTNCELFCIQKKIIDECGCFYLYYDKIDSSTKPCAEDSDITCTKSFFAKVISGIKDIDCRSECPPECSKVSYDFYSSSSDFPSQKHYELLVKKSSVNSTITGDGIQVNYEEVKKRIVSVSIYFKELSYTKISESPKTSAVDLIASIGGTFGLCLGLSILSFIEIIHLFIILVYFIKDIKMNKVENSDKTDDFIKTVIGEKIEANRQKEKRLKE
jgi:hypothetical protein